MESPVDAIRERYPIPTTLLESLRGSRFSKPYCVMGALKLFQGSTANPFPDYCASAMLLTKENHNLSGDKAFCYAQSIVRANDSHNFEAAWSLLNEALLYGKRTS